MIVFAYVSVFSQVRVRIGSQLETCPLGDTCVIYTHPNTLDPLGQPSPNEQRYMLLSDFRALIGATGSVPANCNDCDSENELAVVSQTSNAPSNPKNGDVWKDGANSSIYYNGSWIALAGAGNDGADGLSAYQVWLNNGNSGTEQDFLASLIGAQGAQGIQGIQGPAGNDGQDGADGAQGPQGIQGVQGETGAQGPQGNNGQDGADGANGSDGADGLSAYQIWLNAGNSGTEAQFLQSLVGADGANGTNGTDGADGTNGLSAYEQWLAAGNTGSTNDFLQSLVGADGANGTDGQDGAQGPQGIQGIQGPQGLQGISGTNGNDGINCWDVNGNGVDEPIEDTNGDGNFNGLDCIFYNNRTEFKALNDSTLIVYDGIDYDNDGEPDTSFVKFCFSCIKTDFQFFSPNINLSNTNDESIVLSEICNYANSNNYASGSLISVDGFIVRKQSNETCAIIERPVQNIPQNLEVLDTTVVPNEITTNIATYGFSPAYVDGAGNYNAASTFTNTNLHRAYVTDYSNGAATIKASGEIRVTATFSYIQGEDYFLQDDGSLGLSADNDGDATDFFAPVCTVWNSLGNNEYILILQFPNNEVN